MSDGVRSSAADPPRPDGSSAGELEGEVERLLELHDELDELTGRSGSWATPIWIALAFVVILALVRVFTAGLSLQVAVQFGLVLVMGLVAVGVPLVLRRKRLNELKARIEEFETTAPRQSLPADGD